MRDVQDYELFRPEQPPPQDRPRRLGLWIAAGVGVVAIAIAAYIAFGSRSRGSSAPASTASDRAGAVQRPLGGEPAPIVLPPLDETDALVRELVRQLSSHPQVAAWLATDGLIRNFTVVVANTAEGQAPTRHLRVLRPTSNFEVVERNSDRFIDPRSYDRYNELAAAAASIDPAGAARLYATLKPRIEEAYRDLGSLDTPFDRTLERAIVLLLETPVRDGPVRVHPEARGIGYGFDDQKLEALTAAQKQLLRTGPRNARAIQSSLRQMALALGIPPERLPPPSSQN
jgi:Protein of unknown function (DUF3014)